MMNRLCEDEIVHISKYIKEDIDFMNYRKSTRTTYNAHYRRNIYQSRKKYITIFSITYVLIHTIIYALILWKLNLLIVLPPNILILIYVSYRDMYSIEERTLTT